MATPRFRATALLAARQRARLTQLQLATRAVAIEDQNLTTDADLQARRVRTWESRIGAWEKGIDSPSPSYIPLLARLLGLEPMELFEIDPAAPSFTTLRVAAGFTLQALADSTGIPYTSLHRMSRGISQLPDPEAIAFDDPARPAVHLAHQVDGDLLRDALTIVSAGNDRRLLEERIDAADLTADRPFIEAVSAMTTAIDRLIAVAHARAGTAPTLAVSGEAGRMAMAEEDRPRALSADMPSVVVDPLANATRQLEVEVHVDDDFNADHGAKQEVGRWQ